jgi:hypothetical protein
MSQRIDLNYSRVDLKRDDVGTLGDIDSEVGLTRHYRDGKAKHGNDNTRDYLFEFEEEGKSKGCVEW